MKRFVLVYLLLCGLILILLGMVAGCSTDYVDANEYIFRSRNKFRPKENSFILPGQAKTDYSLYCADGCKANLKIERRRFLKYEVGIKVYWENEKTLSFPQKFEPYQIFLKCKPYINNKPYGELTFEKYCSVIGKKTQKQNDSQISTSAKELALAFQEEEIAAEIIDKKYCIICLDPLVVVVLDIENIAWNRVFSYRNLNREALYLRKKDSYFYKYDPHNLYRGRVVIFTTNMSLIASGLILPDGLDYGLEMPYVEKPHWFSPDMKVKDELVEMLSETKGRIEVSWGYLYLTKQEDKWVVTAEKK